MGPSVFKGIRRGKIKDIVVRINSSDIVLGLFSKVYEGGKYKK